MICPKCSNDYSPKEYLIHKCDRLFWQKMWTPLVLKEISPVFLTTANVTSIIRSNYLIDDTVDIDLLNHVSAFINAS